MIEDKTGKMAALRPMIRLGQVGSLPTGIASGPSNFEKASCGPVVFSIEPSIRSSDLHRNLMKGF